MKTFQIEGKACFYDRISLRLRLIVGNGSSELPDQIVAFSEQRVDTALAFWNIWANVEFAINPHIINRIELI